MTFQTVTREQLGVVVGGTFTINASDQQLDAACKEGELKMPTNPRKGCLSSVWALGVTQGVTESAAEINRLEQLGRNWRE